MKNFYNRNNVLNHIKGTIVIFFFFMDPYTKALHKRNKKSLCACVGVCDLSI